jgi:putative endonuclease
VSARRRRAYLLGLRAEIWATLYLRLFGWRILARRWQDGGGEIDIVAMRGDVVAFVEVKARPSLDQAAEAVTRDKARRMSRAARAWAARHPWSAGKVLRGDALLMAPRRWPRHAPGAVELEF